jgi:2-isopropylmalate synthase
MSGIPTATVKMRGPDMVERYVATTGTGPVDAVYKAIDQIMGVSVTLENYSLIAVNEGIEVSMDTSCIKLSLMLTPRAHFALLPHSFILTGIGYYKSKHLS